MRKSVWRRLGNRGFTILEVLVSVGILSLILLMLVSLTNQTSATWRYTTAKAEQFRQARVAFENMTGKISQATLNTYWDYGYDSSGFPTRYERRSELRFSCGPATSLIGATGFGTRTTHSVFFHAPLGLVHPSYPDHHGLEGLLNVWGYYVELNSDADQRPAFLSKAVPLVPLRYRHRLMEFMQASELMSTYGYTSGLDGGLPASVSYQGSEWYRIPVNTSASLSRPIAENVIALIITPRLSKRDELELRAGSIETDFSPLSPRYLYDSALTMNAGQTRSDGRTNPKNQLPPLLQVTMVAIDEASAMRLRLVASSGDFFKVGAKFVDTTKYTGDLVVQPTGTADISLENTLISKRVNYRIFTTNIPIRAAKWSRDQIN